MATATSLPRTFVSVSHVILLSVLVTQISAVKYSEYLLPGETGKFITETSSGEEQLCHICQDDLQECVNHVCRSQNSLNVTATFIPWCYCGPVVGCDLLPSYAYGAYRCWPFGQWIGTVYQTCIPHCETGFRLIQGNGLRCGEDMRWNETVVPPICTNESTTTALKSTPTPFEESANVSFPPSDNETEDQVEESFELSPVVIGPLAGVVFLGVMFVVVWWCCKYNKRCHKWPQRKSPVTELSSIEAAGADVSLEVSDEDAMPTPSNSTTVSVHTSENSEPDERVPLLPLEMPINSGEEETIVKEVAEPEGDPTDSAKSSKEAEDRPVVDDNKPSTTNSFSLASTDLTISFPSTDTSKTGTEIQQGSSELEQVQQTDSRNSAVRPEKQSTENVSFLRPVGDGDYTESRYEPDGADSLNVDAPRGESQKGEQHGPESLSTHVTESPNTPLKHRQDQGFHGERAHVAEFTSPTFHPQETCASPAMEAGNYYQTHDPHQAGGHHQSEARECEESRAGIECEESRAGIGACIYNRLEASDDHQGHDIIDDGDCVTFCDFQNERNALEFFTRLDKILVSCTDEERNWFGVSMRILLGRITDLVETLKGLTITLRNPAPGSAYFDYVIKHYFTTHGVKLGQVLYFYTKIHPQYQILQLFKKYHPKCRYCEKFYGKS
ncbi:uncharacterized protein LOC110449687 isoform X2 [Mizuhopecten yessoensis]|uniref:uncharacterized protein LOC110449687 isoform X2 n=1 Tax=Mizuhopecten yessoensis TaxID=6573 RepID=UPI000B45961C|nr:uncharacterized protein LOC110449687 isoform X2 [Mizuhopecten yessoensis]